MTKSNMSIERRVVDGQELYLLYSYEAIVGVVKGRTCYMTTRKWSVTTTKHQTLFRGRFCKRLRLMDDASFMAKFPTTHYANGPIARRYLTAQEVLDVRLGKLFPKGLTLRERARAPPALPKDVTALYLDRENPKESVEAMHDALEALFG
jgi:hypothetical protein